MNPFLWMTGTSLRSRALAAGVASHGRPLPGGAGGGLCGAAVSCGHHLRNHPQKMAPGKAGEGMGCLGPETHGAASSPPQGMFAAGSPQLRHTQHRAWALFPLYLLMCVGDLLSASRPSTTESVSASESYRRGERGPAGYPLIF